MLSKGNMISFTFLHLNIHLKLPNFKISSNFFFSIFDSHLVYRITSSQRFHALSEGKALRGRSPETFRYAKMPREALQREYFRLIRSITVTFSSKMIRTTDETMLRTGGERKRRIASPSFDLGYQTDRGAGLSFLPAGLCKSAQL